MTSILPEGTIDKLPVVELSATLDLFLEPVLGHLPEKRLREVGKLAVQYVLLAGISAVFLTVSTLAFAAQYPFPRSGGTYG